MKPHGSRWYPETCAPREHIRSLYLSGLSSRKVAKMVGYSYSYVDKICKDIRRSKREANKPAVTTQSKHWRTCRAFARRLMERHLGRKLRTREHVHHLNGDFTDNRLENLQVIDVTEHCHVHRPPNPVPRWLRPKRKEYMRSYLKKYWRRKNAAQAPC